MALVTVFGGSGFVGRAVVKRLAKAGWRIRVAVRRPEEAGFLRPMGDVGQIALIQANLRHDPSVRAALAGADAAINLVGILAEGGRQRFDLVHAQGPARLAEAAAAAGVGALVHLSAIGADPESPAAYARSKAAGEVGVRNGFPGAVILRPSIIFGPEDRFFNGFAQLARYAPVLPLIGGGATRFQPVFVGDVAAAVVAALTAPPADRAMPCELGGPEVLSFRQILEFVLQVTGRRRLLVPVPWPLAGLLAAATGWLPGAPLTGDQVKLLKVDNVVRPGNPGFAPFGVVPTSVEAVVPSYLQRFRRTGQFVTDH